MRKGKVVRFDGKCFGASVYWCSHTFTFLPNTIGGSALPLDNCWVSEYNIYQTYQLADKSFLLDLVKSFKRQGGEDDGKKGDRQAYSSSRLLVD